MSPLVRAKINNCCNQRILPVAFFHQHWLLAEAVLEAVKVNRLPK